MTLMNLRVVSFPLLVVSLACGANTTTCPEQMNVHAIADTSPPSLSNPSKAPESLKVTSTSFKDGTTIAMKYVFKGCGGENVSPALSWEGAPEGTKSFAIVAHDPDAPTGVGFFHWLAFDIPAGTTQLNEGQLPEGASTGHNDFGSTGYGGPCPPPGSPHRYIFTVYALDKETLGLDQNSTGAFTRFNLNNHTLALGRIHGTFGIAK